MDSHEILRRFFENQSFATREDLSRISQNVQALNQTVRNGLSERTRRTEDTVNSIQEDLQAFKQAILQSVVTVIKEDGRPDRLVFTMSRRTALWAALAGLGLVAAVASNETLLEVLPQMVRMLLGSPG